MSRLPAHSYQSVAATTVLRPVDRLHERLSHKQRRNLSAAPPAAATLRRLASHSQRVDHRRWCDSESDVEKLEHQMALPSRVARRRRCVCASLLRVNLHSATSWPSFSCELEPLIAAASSLDRAFAAQPSATVARREPGRLRLSEAERSVPLCRDRSRLALRCFERRDCCIREIRAN